MTTPETPAAITPATPGRLPRARLVLAGSMFVMGIAGMLYEYALASIGNNMMGSSHEQIFVIIGLMMFAMGIGAAVQRKFTGPVLDLFIAAELALALLGGLSCLIAYAAYGFMTSYGVVLYSLALAIGFLVGLEVPLLIRINETYAKALRSNLGDILSMDYVGSLAGALLFAYVLLAKVPLTQIALAAGVVSVLVAAFGLFYFRGLVRRPRTLALACVATLATLSVAWFNAERWVIDIEQRTYEDPIVFRETSVYQHVVLTERNDHLRMYINGHLQFSSRDEAIYHELLVHTPMALAARHDRVLILGGGDGLALREVLEHAGVREVVLVDIDPVITRLAAEHPRLVEVNRAAFSDARVSDLAPAGITPGEMITVTRPSTLAAEYWDDRDYELADVSVIHLDAELFLRDLNGPPFNVIIADFPDPKQIAIAKLYSVGFYTRVQRHLAEGGIMSVQSSSPYHAPLVFAGIGKTLETAGFVVLPYHHNVPSFGDWGFHLAWRSADADLPPTPAAMTGRVRGLRRFAAPTDAITPDVLAAALAFPDGWVDTGTETIRPNTQMRPVLVEYHRRSWRK
ncbi:MAG: polyamine aminopropyltransferase [Planctomycetota bacterium]